MKATYLSLVAVVAVACGPPVNRAPEATVAAPAVDVSPTPELPPYSEPAGEIVRMVRAGLSEAMIRNQILLRRTPANISPDEIIRMSREGVSQSLLAVLQQHDAQLVARERSVQERSSRDDRLRRELQAEIAKLRNELRTNRPAVISSAAPPPQIVVQHSQPVREIVTERTIVHEQVPVYVGYGFFPGASPPARNQRSNPTYVSGAGGFVPPRQGDAGFAAPVTGFAPPAFSAAPATGMSGGSRGWRYYTGPGASGN